MNRHTEYHISDKWIISKRGRKNSVDPEKPYAFLVEKERTYYGNIEDTAVVFLTNKECPYRCLMCDLWKNTTNNPVPRGAIPSQIEWALKQLQPAKHLKLYNSGSFFDGGAIPEEDYPQIAGLVNDFKTVIVESHANLVKNKCLRFRDLLKPELEVAIGLETANPEILQKLNKKMTLDDFKESVQFLTSHKIRSRAFLLHSLPFLTEIESTHWTKKSIEYAFDSGVECCTIIPTRSGNGVMDLLMDQGNFIQPGIQSLEEVLEYGIGLNRGLVFADAWDLKSFSKCDNCFEERLHRLVFMNLKQRKQPKVKCTCS